MKIFDDERPVAMVAAQWHADIVDRAVDSFEARLKTSGIVVQLHRVPGAFEIPLLVRRLARSGRFAAVATAALVVDGGIYRHEFVAQSVVKALMQIQLAEDTPVFSGVLTPHHFHDHDVHRQQFADHFVTKGSELADAVVATIPVLAKAAQSGKPG